MVRVPDMLAAVFQPRFGSMSVLLIWPSWLMALQGNSVATKALRVCHPDFNRRVSQESVEWCAEVITVLRNLDQQFNSRALWRDI